MNISVDQLAEQVRRARARGWTTVTRKAEKRSKLPAGLLLALASRETDMNDIVGDKGHGRGLFQIDDRFHADWLAGHGAPGPAPTLVRRIMEIRHAARMSVFGRGVRTVEPPIVPWIAIIRLGFAEMRADQRAGGDGDGMRHDRQGRDGACRLRLQGDQ